MCHHVAVPIAVGRVLGTQSAPRQVRADRLIADVHEEVAVTNGTDPEEQTLGQTKAGFAKRIDRAVQITRLSEWDTLFKDLITADIVTYQTAQNLGLRREQPSLGFLHNVNHADRAYTPVGLCSALEFVTSAKTHLYDQRDAIARELDQETVDRVVQLSDRMGIDETIQFLESLLATSIHFGPLIDARTINRHNLKWRLTQYRHNIADRITKVWPDWERFEGQINAKLPAGRSLEDFFGE